MRGIARWNRRAGAWIEDIIADLCGVEGARIDDPVKRGGVADRSDAKEADLALLPQSLEGRDDLTEHSLGGKAAVAAICSNMIVQLEQIDAIELQALQTRLQRGRDRRAGSAAFAVRNAHFSADHDVGLQTLDDASEITLGLAIAIHRGGIEIVNAELDRTGDRPLLVGGVAAHHQPADGTASEPEERNIEAGPAECASFHRLLRCFGARRGSNPERPRVSILPEAPRSRTVSRNRNGRTHAQIGSLAGRVSARRRRSGAGSGRSSGFENKG